LLLLLHAIPAISAHERFDEQLTLRPLPDGKVHAQFRFLTTVSDPAEGVPFLAAPPDAPLHTTLLPLSLTQLLRTYDTPELHLSLNAGKWDPLRWGQPGGALRTGAEMWAWVSDSPEDEKAGEGEGGRWQGLTNGLAGLFCASLSSQMEQRTTSPRLAFRPEGDLPSRSHYTAHKLYHASHPSESICTENLTPFLKLLPCQARAGIAQLLNPHRVFSADWHGVGVHVRWKNETGETELEMQVGAVFDPVRVSGGKRAADWSLTSLFDRPITRACPAAASSTLNVLLPPSSEQSIHELLPPPAQMLTRDGKFEAVYDLAQVGEELDVAMRWLEERFDYTKAHYAPPELSIRRSLKGGSGLAELSIILSNALPEPRRVLYVETLPWFLSLFLHTLKTEVGGVAREDILQSISYLPPVSPKPTLLELTLLLPASSQVHLTMQAEKGFIRYTEHQPDASRGWDLPAAVVFPLPQALNTSPSSSREGAGLTRGELAGQGRIYSSTLLVDLPTPDFSMPYNVIIMSSTLVALFFGSVFNCLTRKFVVLRM
ncbi:Gpi16 subunit, GPI transamidase component, partial [Calocera viscosa TUFC12733]